MPNNPHEEQALLEQLRASADPADTQKAAQLQAIYHDRQMGILAADVYNPSKGRDKAPAGWIRISDDPGKYAARFHMTPAELRDQLHPDKSGFRAEIYLPDPRVLGSGYQPVVAIKGSSGEVQTSDGKWHDTTKEDFLANNFPQSVGMETDYYDRAMRLASDLKLSGFQFELTGHSLSGGLVSAASAVTGYRATTWNAAGLNPQTVLRFGEQNHIPVYNNEQLKSLVTAYQVQGELLSDGVQGNIHRFDAIQRAEVGGLLKETSQLLKELPQGRELLTQQMGEDMPSGAQVTVRAFVDKIATGDVDQMLRELPLAAGTVQPALAAMTRQNPDDLNSPLVPRAQIMSLPEVTALAGPVLETLSIAAAGAYVGERGGAVVAFGGQATARMMHDSGTVLRAVAEFEGQRQRSNTWISGAVLQSTTHYVGEAAARTSALGGAVLAGTNEGIGRAQQAGASLDASLLRGLGSVLPETAQKWMDDRAAQVDGFGEASRRANHAQTAEILRNGMIGATAIRDATQLLATGTGQAMVQTGNFQHDLIAGSGSVAAGTLDATGQIIASGARQAPSVGAGVGALIATDVALVSESTPANFPRLAEAAKAIAQAGPAANEALSRHLMEDSVLPSLDARIKALEQAMPHLLEQTAAPATTAGVDRNSPHVLSNVSSVALWEQHRTRPMSDTDRVIAGMHKAVMNGDSSALNAASATYLDSPTGHAMGQQIQRDTQTLQEQAARMAQQQLNPQQQGATQQSQGSSR